MAQGIIPVGTIKYVGGNVGRASPIRVAYVGEDEGTRFVGPAVSASMITLSRGVYLAITVGVGKNSCF